jgi:hypothetical protein
MTAFAVVRSFDGRPAGGSFDSSDTSGRVADMPAYSIGPSCPALCRALEVARALCFLGDADCKARAGSVARRRLRVQRHCERSEAIQDSTKELDCFVASAPRNDGVERLFDGNYRVATKSQRSRGCAPKRRLHRRRLCPSAAAPRATRRKSSRPWGPLRLRRRCDISARGHRRA